MSTEIPPALHREAFHLITGAELGRGQSRTTYVYAVTPEYVVKVETDAGDFQNVLEWEMWQTVKDTEHARWFAPCVLISGNGSILIMRRTEPVPVCLLPKSLPDFLCDFKPDNYGLLNGKVVCHDYGKHLGLERGLSKRMQKVNWRV
jgi:hypothetical protein